MDKETLTPKQRNSMHKYLRGIAEDLADSGQDMKKIITVPIKPTMENVKEYMFKAVMNHMYPDVESTEDLTTIQVQEVYKQFDYILAEKFGVSRPWPSIESEQNEATN